MHIVLIGPTGSGKSTVAQRLTESLGVPYVSSGDIARQLASTDPATRLALDHGLAAPEEAMRFQVQRALEQAEVQQGGWILDGFPRTLEQLICLLQWTSALPSFFYFEIEPWTCIERLVARGRSDDTADAIARRLESFEQKTHPLISVLDGGGVLSLVNAHASTDAIQTHIEESLR